MGFRFRRSVKIAPGVRVNFGKRGSSLSFGGRGATVTMGKNGVYGNVSIPGTGISFREKLSGSSPRQRSVRSVAAAQEPETVNMAINVHVSDDGTLEFTDKDGGVLDKKFVSTAWKQHPEALKKMLDEKAEEINGDINLLTHVFTDIPHPESEPEYEPIEFGEPEPVAPDAPKESKRPEKQKIKRPFFLLMFFEQM